MDVHLSEEQRYIVEYKDGALLVLAGPGSGKTRVLTERVRRLISEPEQHFRILALTFTNKAANEMRDRLSEFPDIGQRTFIGTFHSFAREVLSSRGAAVGLESLPHIFESSQDRAQILLEAASADPDLSPLLRAVDATERGRLIHRWLEAISVAKTNLQEFSDLADLTIRRAYEVYDDGLRTCDAIDFDDLLLLTYRLFSERPRIADFYRRQYRYICIDEAQDMNIAQFRLLVALCGDSYRNVMMVGDPRQAIFAWNGADSKLLNEFSEHFSAKRIDLTENFRCSRAVVAAAKALIPSYEVGGVLPVSGAITEIRAADEEDEAKRICNELEKLLVAGHLDVEGPITLERCAIISRTRFAMTVIVQQVLSRGWPHFQQLTAQQVSESDMMQEFELALRVRSNPRDELHLRALAKRWSAAKISYQQPVTNEDVIDCLGQLAYDDRHRAIVQALESMGDVDNVKFMQAAQVLGKYAETLVDEDRALVEGDLRVWEDHWDTFLRHSQGGEHSLSIFLADLALGATQHHVRDGLALLTVHSAKGLEFDVVFVVGLADGTFPDYRAQGPALLEERRNAFVAVTRTRRLLYLSFPRSRLMPWGDKKAQQPSRFLQEIRQANVENWKTI